LHGQLQCVPPMLMDQLVGQVLVEVINSFLVTGPNTWRQQVLQACKQQVTLIHQTLALSF